MIKKILHIIILISIFVFTQGCISPVFFKYENKKYENTKTTVSILPVYGDVDQIKYFQSTSPFLKEFNFDNTYNQIDTLYMQYYDENKKDRRNKFYLIISTNF